MKRRRGPAWFLPFVATLLAGAYLAAQLVALRVAHRADAAASEGAR